MSASQHILVRHRPKDRVIAPTCRASSVRQSRMQSGYVRRAPNWLITTPSDSRWIPFALGRWRPKSGRRMSSEGRNRLKRLERHGPVFGRHSNPPWSKLRTQTSIRTTVCQSNAPNTIKRFPYFGATSRPSCASRTMTRRKRSAPLGRQCDQQCCRFCSNKWARCHPAARGKNYLLLSRQYLHSRHSGVAAQLRCEAVGRLVFGSPAEPATASPDSRRHAGCIRSRRDFSLVAAAVMRCPGA